MWLKKRLNTNQTGHIVGLVVLIISIAAAATLFLNRQQIVDQISIWQYTPTEEIAALAQRTRMNDGGRFYFYSSQPSVEGAETFNKECTRKEESTAILGCYNGRNIFIYDVTDTRLSGIKEVTAAHEMLHAAYDRLSSDEKTRVNKLLEAEYEKIKDGKEFAERMAFYARTEPSERYNELHSIIGTEVETLPAELEIYYKKYFSDRQQVASLHKKYANVFLQLQARSDQLSAELTQVGAAIEADSALYNSQVAQLNADIEAFNTKAENGGFVSHAQFQAERNALLTRANQLDERRSAINAGIVKYNQLRAELEAVASQSEALNRSINSNLAPAPSI